MLEEAEPTGSGADECRECVHGVVRFHGRCVTRRKGIIDGQELPVWWDRQAAEDNRLVILRGSKGEENHSPVPPPANNKAKITSETVEQIFRSAFQAAARGKGRSLPAGIDFQQIAADLNRPTAPTISRRGLRELKRAIGVVLDEAPKVLEAETRHFSADARKRADAYAQLIKAAHDLRDAGVSIPKVQFAPRETEQAQRDRRHVFAMVYKALGEAEKAKIGRTDESLGIQIVCNLLAELGWGEITPEALSRMMKREAARPKPWYLVKVRCP